jgi:hypothetical protein
METLLGEQVLRANPDNLALALDDDAIPTFLVTKQGIADALAEGLIDSRPLIAKDAIWVFGGDWFHAAFCRTMRSHLSLS